MAVATTAPFREGNYYSTKDLTPYPCVGSTRKRNHVTPAAATYKRPPRMTMCTQNMASIQKASMLNFGIAIRSPRMAEYSIHPLGTVPPTTIIKKGTGTKSRNAANNTHFAERRGLRECRFTDVPPSAPRRCNHY